MFVVLELPDGRPAVVRVGDELTFMGESDFPSIRVRAVCATRAEALAWVAANM